jgi:putative ATP-dependent endonuclease of OLD family
MLMDSDKRARNAQLNTTKRRIIDEFGSFGGMVWVTKGRAIENYLPLAALKEMLPEADLVPGDYDDFQEFLERLKKGEGKKFARNKVLFAETIVPFMTVENWAPVLDVGEKVMRASKEVAKWNAIPVTWA